MSNGSIHHYQFTTSKGRTYEIIATESKGFSVWDAVDTVKNPEGRFKSMRREKTLELINS